MYRAYNNLHTSESLYHPPRTETAARLCQEMASAKMDMYFTEMAEAMAIRLAHIWTWGIVKGMSKKDNPYLPHREWPRRLRRQWAHQQIKGTVETRRTKTA